MNYLDAYRVFKEDSCLFNKDTRTLYILDKGEDGESLQGVLLAKFNVDNKELVDLVNKFEAVCCSVVTEQKPKNVLKNFALSARMASVDPLDNTVLGLKIGSEIQFESIPFDYPVSMENHDKKETMDMALLDYCNHLETDHLLTHMVTAAQFLAEIYTEKSSLNYEVVLDELNSLESNEENGNYFNRLSSITKNFFQPDENRENVTEISLDDIVKYGYIGNDGLAVQESMTVKELIDDWYEECNFLGANDDILTETYINGKSFSNGDDGKIIEDLMEYLVKSTEYTSQIKSEFDKIPKERRDEYLAAGISTDDLIRCFEFGWQPEDITKGYIACQGDWEYDISNALQIQSIGELGYYEDDTAAREQATRDGVAFINDIPDLEKGVYIDTPENRKICIDALENMPELRIYNILTHANISAQYREDYIKKYGDPRVEITKEYDTVNESSGMTKKDETVILHELSKLEADIYYSNRKNPLIEKMHKDLYDSVKIWNELTGRTLDDWEKLKVCTPFTSEEKDKLTLCPISNDKIDKIMAMPELDVVNESTGLKKREEMRILTTLSELEEALRDNPMFSNIHEKINESAKTIGKLQRWTIPEWDIYQSVYKSISTSDNKIVEEVPKPKELANELLEKMATAGYSIEDVQKHMAELQKSVKDIMFKDPEMHKRLKLNENKSRGKESGYR